MFGNRRSHWVSIGLLLSAGMASLWLRPLLPVDETRYLSVAWEMWQKGDFILPILNGDPYTHKPPLLFWLIHAEWAVLGVNAYAPRLISLVCALVSLPLVSNLAANLWPERPVIRDYAPLILASFMCWLVYSTTLMFDVLLGVFVLAAIAAGVRASLSGRIAWFAVCGTLLGAGLLTKGPVILLSTLPVLLLMPWWRRSETRLPLGRWYAGLALAVVTGAAIMLAWVYPAILRGGPTFSHELIWKQTAGRIAESFAHAHPWYWYLMLLPLLLFPWGVLVWEKAWRGRLWRDPGERFCVAWFGVSLIAFSLVSGKQVHYLIPTLPAIALWLAARYADRPITRVSQVSLGGISILAGLALLFTPEWCELSGVEEVCTSSPRLGALLPLAIGFILLRARPDAAPRMAWIAITSGALFLGLLMNFVTIFRLQDVQPLAQRIKALQDQDIKVVNVDKYHDQYQFAGRLEKPLLEIREPTLDSWAAEHPEACLIFYVHSTDNPLAEIASEVYPYRGKQALMITAEDWLAYKRRSKPPIQMTHQD